MKKLLAILLAALLILSLAACGGNEKPDAPDAPDTSSVESALALLTEVWGSYNDDDKFPAAGGDTSEENMTMDAPGKFVIDDTAALDATLGFPAASADKIDEAASLVHMMNANTFTCGAFHVTDAEASADVAAAIKDNIMGRQWICGFPDKLVIVKVGDYIVSVFGENEIIDTFKTNLTAAYASAETICDESIA